MKRGEIWWATLPPPAGFGPGFRRPVLIIQSDPFNESRISTATVAVITSNLALAEAPGNVRTGKAESRLSRPSVVNVSQILTLDKALPPERFVRCIRKCCHGNVFQLSRPNRSFRNPGNARMCGARIVAREDACRAGATENVLDT